MSDKKVKREVVYIGKESRREIRMILTKGTDCCFDTPCSLISVVHNNTPSEVYYLCKIGEPFEEEEE